MDAVPTSSRETASGDPSPLAAPLQRRGAEGPRFTFSVAARPASRTQTCLVKNRTAKVAENAAPPCRPAGQAGAPAPQGESSLRPAHLSCWTGSPGTLLDQSIWRRSQSPGPERLGTHSCTLGSSRPRPSQAWSQGGRASRCAAAQVAHAPRPRFLDPGPSRALTPVSAAASLQAFRVPGPSPVAQGDISACPRRTRRRRHAISLHQRRPPPSRKVRLSFPHFHSHPFLLSNY